MRVCFFTMIVLVASSYFISGPLAAQPLFGFGAKPNQNQPAAAQNGTQPVLSEQDFANKVKSLSQQQRNQLDQELNEILQQPLPPEQVQSIPASSNQNQVTSPSQSKSTPVQTTPPPAQAVVPPPQQVTPPPPSTTPVQPTQAPPPQRDIYTGFGTGDQGETAAPPPSNGSGSGSGSGGWNIKY